MKERGEGEKFKCEGKRGVEVEQNVNFGGGFGENSRGVLGLAGSLAPAGFSVFSLASPPLFRDDATRRDGRGFPFSFLQTL
jgi:hypothetical protein